VGFALNTSPAAAPTRLKRPQGGLPVASFGYRPAWSACLPRRADFGGVLGPLAALAKLGRNGRAAAAGRGVNAQQQSEHRRARRQYVHGEIH
jgi:hypothetical protein